ncbi:MAG: fibronectin type III domain-containing protein [Chloroflexi bacterium]|nr:fibronectin type III domain-containing protein [Chloroflexota bacterium]
MRAGARRAASLLIATMALVTLGVAIAQAQWPTTCVELNDLAEAAAGNHQNVGIYQRAYGDQAEAQCQSDHRDDVRRTFAWALGGVGEAVAGTWPTSCVALNDLAEAALGNSGNVGIYQQVYPDDAEAERACRSDHRADVIATFAWAIPTPVPEPTPEPVHEATPTPRSTPPAEHPDHQRVRDVALARGSDADLATAVASDVIERGATDSFLRGTDAGVQFGQWNCPSRSAACPLAPEATSAPPTPQTDQSTQSQAPGTGPSIRLSDLVPRGEVSIWDGAEIYLYNLDPGQTYEVLVTSSNPAVVGIGDCLGLSEWTTLTGSTSRIMWFVVRGCTVGNATVTVQVRLAGTNTVAAIVNQLRTTIPIPSVPEFQQASVERAEQEVRDLLARGGPDRPVQRPYPPRVTYRYEEQTPTSHTLYWATWWATRPTDDVQITGFQMRHWPHDEPSRTTTVDFTDPNAWRHTLTGLTPDTWYSVSMRACTNQDDCSAAEWSHRLQFKTPPG